MWNYHSSRLPRDSYIISFPLQDSTSRSRCLPNSLNMVVRSYRSSCWWVGLPLHGNPRWVLTPVRLPGPHPAAASPWSCANGYTFLATHEIGDPSPSHLHLIHIYIYIHIHIQWCMYIYIVWYDDDCINHIYTVKHINTVIVILYV